MRRKLVTAATTLALMSALVACSAETEEPTADDSPRRTTQRVDETAGGGDIDIPVAGGGGSLSGGGSAGGGGESAGESASTDTEEMGGAYLPDLHLICRPRDSNFARGEPIVVELEVQNKGRAPTYLVEPGFDLRQNLMIQLREAGQWQVVARGQRWNEADEPEIVLLEPNTRVVVSVDLLPLVGQTLAYEEGRLRFRVLYDGGADLLKTPNNLIWNPTGQEALRSDEVQIEIDAPNWMEDFELDEDFLAGVELELQGLRGVDDPGFPKAVANLREMGEPAALALVFTMEALGSRVASRARLGGLALAAVRALGKDGLAALDRAKDYPHPVRTMARGVLLEDLRVAGGESLGPMSEAARALGAGEGGASLLVEFSPGTEYPKGRRFLLTDSGVLLVTDAPGTEAEIDVVSIQLATEDLVDLKRAVLGARLWHLQQVRTSPRASEGWAFFALTHDGRQTLKARVQEREAAEENPLSAAVCAALKLHAERAARLLANDQ